MTTRNNKTEKISFKIGKMEAASENPGHKSIIILVVICVFILILIGMILPVLGSNILPVLTGIKTRLP